MQVQATFDLPKLFADFTPLSVTPDASRAMFASDKALQVLDVASGSVTSSSSSGRGGTGQCIAPDGKAYAQWGLTQSKRIRVWREGKKKFAAKSLTLDVDVIKAAAFLADGRLMCGDDRGHIAFAGLDGQCEHRFDLPASVMHPGVRKLWPLADGTVLIAGGDEGVPNRSGALYRYTPQDDDARSYGVFVSAKCHALNPEQTMLAVGYAVSTDVLLVDLVGGGTRKLPIPEADVRSLAFSSSGEQIFVATKDGWNWAVLDVETGEICRRGEHLEQRSTAMLHPESGMVIEWRERKLRAIDVSSGEALVLPRLGRPLGMAAVSRGPAFIAYSHRIVTVG